MKIVHVLSIENAASNGISSVVPQYAENQKKYVDVDIIDLCNNTNFDLKYEDTDLFVLHGVYNIKMLKFWRKYINGKYKYIYVPHGGFTKVSQNKGKLKKMIANKFLFLKMYKSAEAIQYLCEYEKTHSIDLGNTRGIVCPNGITVPNINQHNIICNDKITLLYIGRLDAHHKGIDLLLKAICVLHSFLVNNNVLIELIGVCRDGSNRAMKDFIKYNKLDDIVTFNDNGIFGEEKINKILNASCFIQTSRLEGLPLGILEALSYGTPVAVTDPVGVSDVVEKYGCGFHCGCTVKEIVRMIKLVILNKNKLQEMSTAAYQAANFFEWDNVTKSTLKKYNEIVKELK